MKVHVGGINTGAGGDGVATPDLLGEADGTQAVPIRNNCMAYHYCIRGGMPRIGCIITALQKSVLD